jgi:hypothetical protein
MRAPLSLFLPFAALAAAQSGADASAATDAVHPQIRACATLRNNAERLACYDQAIESLSSSDADAGAVGGTAAPSAETMFGLESREARAANAQEQDAREELAALKARVSGLGTNKDGMRTIQLDNGQVWRQLSAATNLLLQVGDEVTVSRAALNSFRITAPGGRAAKVTRVR